MDIDDLARGFDYWDPSLGPDPYPLLRAFRDRCPVVRSEAHGGYTTFVRFNDVFDALRDPETFSSRVPTIPPYDRPEGSPSVTPPLDLDPPEHTRFRQILLPFFTPQRAANLEPLARETARRLLDELDGAPGCEVMSAYAFQLPSVVIADILGVDGGDYERFIEWVEVIVDQSGDDVDATIRAHMEVCEYLSGLLDTRTTAPIDDLLTFLLTAEVDSVPLADHERLATASLLLIAGIDTTANTLGNALWYLAQHPDERARLAADPSLLDTAVEEFLRMYAPVSIVRTATTDTHVAGCPISSGTPVLMSIPSANRDDRKFPEAETLTLDRQPNAHIAFGAGVHRCIGAHIARMELQVGLEEWLRAIPDFELDGGPERQEWKAGPIRGPKQIHLCFNPEERPQPAATLGDPSPAPR